MILIGTYWDGQFKKWKGYYNYPISDADKVEPEKINELWLFNGNKQQRTFTAEFVGIKTRKELVSEYKYPAKGSGHGDKYLLYKIKRRLQPSRKIERAFIRLKDFAKRSPKVAAQLKQFLVSTPEGRDAFLRVRTSAALVKSNLPRIVISLPKDKLVVGEAALQMDFMFLLDEVEKKMAKFKGTPPKGLLRFIDLFAGIGGIRKGFELACADRGLKSQCVFTSEIKPHALEVLRQNHPGEYIYGDITKVDETKIPDFDILLGGFPCQAFSAAGKRLGFEDTRGTLFFDVARIIKAKQPFGFVLENVEGLVNHDKRDANAKIGHTLEVILNALDELGYKVSWKVLNASDFGVPQDRKRIYIVGTKKNAPSLHEFEVSHAKLENVIEHGLPTQRSKFIDKLFAHYQIDELHGKSIKDKRGGANNIHSWDIELKGRVSRRQKELLNALLKERRKHQWAEQYGIEWMDGMPLTLEMIQSFFDDDNLEAMLDDLVEKRYVVREHPKKKVKIGNVFVREQDTTLPLGYNIVAGKMSYEISKILSPNEVAPTLVAMDMQHLFVVDGAGLRNLSLREGLRLFGYPDDYKFDVQKDLGYDLLGNTVVVPVIKAVANRVLDVYQSQRSKK